jgi:hypothetical protein
MQIGELLIKYKDVKPKLHGDYVERCYPVSAVISMMNEFKQALQKTTVGDLLNSVQSPDECDATKVK